MNEIGISNPNLNQGECHVKKCFDVPGAASRTIKTLGYQMVLCSIYPFDGDMTFSPEADVFE